MLYVLFNGALLPYEGPQIRTPSELHADKNIVNGIRLGSKAPWPITHYYLNDTKQGQQVHATAAESSHLRGVKELANCECCEACRISTALLMPCYAYNRTNDNVQRKIEFESMMFSKEKKGAVGTLPGAKYGTLNSNTGEMVEKSMADWGMRLKINGNIDDFDFTEMKNPNSNYVQTMEFMARAIAAGTGFPYEIVMHIYNVRQLHRKPRRSVGLSKGHHGPLALAQQGYLISAYGTGA